MYNKHKMVIAMLEHLLATLGSLIVVLVTFLGGFGVHHLGKASPLATSLASELEQMLLTVYALIEARFFIWLQRIAAQAFIGRRSILETGLCFYWRKTDDQ